MKKSTLLILSVVLEILLLSQCSPHVVNRNPDPTNTPPPDFLTPESFFPGEYFAHPTFSADNHLIAVGKTDSIRSAGNDDLDSLYVIDLESNKPIIHSQKNLLID